MLNSADQAKLQALETAYDALISGSAVARVSYDGTDTEYARADMARLEARIESLRAQNTPRRGRTRGAVSFRL